MMTASLPANHDHESELPTVGGKGSGFLHDLTTVQAEALLALEAAMQALLDEVTTELNPNTPITGIWDVPLAKGQEKPV